MRMKRVRDLRKEPAPWRSLLWALDRWLVLYEYLPPIPPWGMQIIGSNSEQTNHPSSNHTYTKSMPNHIHHHYALLQHPHTHTISSTASTYVLHCHPWICGQTPQEWWSCWTDAGISWLVDQKLDDRTPPTNKGEEVSRQQQQGSYTEMKYDSTKCICTYVQGYIIA